MKTEEQIRKEILFQREKAATHNKHGESLMAVLTKGKEIALEWVLEEVNEN